MFQDGCYNFRVHVHVRTGGERGGENDATVSIAFISIGSKKRTSSQDIQQTSLISQWKECHVATPVALKTGVLSIS